MSDDLDDHPYLARQMLVFYTRGSDLCGGESRDLELEGKSEDTRYRFIQFLGRHSRVIPYVLFGVLCIAHCAWMLRYEDLSSWVVSI